MRPKWRVATGVPACASSTHRGARRGSACRRAGETGASVVTGNTAEPSPLAAQYADLRTHAGGTLAGVTPARTTHVAMGRGRSSTSAQAVCSPTQGRQ